MWRIDSKGTSWQRGCEASCKGREQWKCSAVLQGCSHAAHMFQSHFYTGQATGEQEIRVKCLEVVFDDTSKCDLVAAGRFLAIRNYCGTSSRTNGIICQQATLVWHRAFAGDFILLDPAQALVGSSCTRPALQIQQWLCGTLVSPLTAMRSAFLPSFAFLAPNVPSSSSLCSQGDDMGWHGMIVGLAHHYLVFSAERFYSGNRLQLRWKKSQVCKVSSILMKADVLASPRIFFL